MDKVALISFDGLNAAQFELLLSLLPNFASLTRQNSISELISAPFSEAQPIWAEIFTGKPWYQNGCTGYAKPSGSLNTTRIFTEQDLLVRNLILGKPEKGKIHIVVNAPLTEPVENERIWLASAGAPALRVVSPQSLESAEPFKSYKPRPVISMGAAMANSRESILRFIEAEKNRIDCVSTLAKNHDWQVLIYRATIFDHLSHLLGPNFLTEKQLQVTAQLNELMMQLDELMCLLVSTAQQHVVFSAFSHCECRFLFSLNDLFAHQGVLTRLDATSEAVRRREAFATARGDESLLVSQTFPINSFKTISCSPTRAAVYINSRDSFVDGTVHVEEVAQMEERIFSLLTSEICKIGRATIHKNPDRAPGMPSFIIDMNAVEFVEYLPSVMTNADVPFSTHQSNGFVYPAKVEIGSRINPIQPFEILNIFNS